MLQTIHPLTTQAPAVFGGVHLTLLSLTVVVCVVAIVLARRVSNARQQARALRIAGWVLLVIAVIQLIWFLLPANADISRSLPLHYSDILRFVTAIALIGQYRWAVAISYYWGLTLNPQAIVTPHPSMLDGPSVTFLLYWILHIYVLAAPLVLVWGAGFRPDWRDFTVTYSVTIAWALIVMGINAVLGTNYAFVNHAPEGTSLIDLLGPWPSYVVWMAVIAAGLWALMTWPWTRRRNPVPTASGCAQ